MMQHKTRRQVLKGATTLGLLGMAPYKKLLAQTSQITVTSFGGIWEEAVRDIFVAEFTKRTGVNAEVQIGGPSQWMSQIEANLQSPPIDVLVNTIDLALIAGKTGLVEKITVDKAPNLAKIPSRFTDVVDGWGTCFDYGAAGLAYNRERLPNPPKSFVEFVDRCAAGEFVASLPSIAYSPTPQILLWSLADVFGGGVDNLDPAFEAIKRMRDNAVFYGGATEFLNHLASGEADIGIYWDGRTWAYYDTGATWIDFINPTEGAVMNPVVVQKVKNSPDVAWDYIDVMLDAAPQTRFAEVLNYGVTNVDVVYPPELEKRITDWEATRWPPFAEFGPLISEWVDRWNREIGT
ncbi:MAG: extracellular solute-binding protein [Kiloniellales bacterium]|nr:extracellular solute-binding protein [Kiloniellales bacterium]